MPRLYHTAQGALIGAIVAFGLCAFAYLDTHKIKFSSVASNEAPALITAQNESVSIAEHMPDVSSLPARKPKVTP